MIIAHHRHKFPDPVWDADLALWFEAAALPEEPFELYSGVSVVDARKCYEALRSDVALGPQGPRARAVQEDLAVLKRLFGKP